MARTKVELPATVDEAVRLLQSIVPQAEQARIAALQESALITLDLSLGMWIRNNLGMWQGNAALLDATGQETADGASDVIIRAFWVVLRQELPKLH